MIDYSELRKNMVEKQLVARGVSGPRVLAAMLKIPREIFLPSYLSDQAYSDVPLEVESEEVLPQPYIVAYMAEALDLSGPEKILVFGAGAGYTAAVLAELVSDVYVIEADERRADIAARNVIKSGHHNVHVRYDQGTRGWDEHAPFDAILVSGATSLIPETLKNRLATGGRLVVPVGLNQRAQELVRVIRHDKSRFTQEDYADLRFVPPLLHQEWEGEAPMARAVKQKTAPRQAPAGSSLPEIITHHAEAFDTIDDANLDALIERVGDRRVVLIGEASHGTSEFYRMRAKITKRLIEEKGFTIIAAEADWPDAARIDQYVRHRETPSADWEAFARFPTWMWRNAEVEEFANWLRDFNESRLPQDRAGFYGLDLYSLFTSTRAIIDYLDGVDKNLAQVARHRYGCLSPWESDPAAYGHAALNQAFKDCEDDVTDMLVDLHRNRQRLIQHDGERFLDAAQNAYLVANAERYYRIMYHGSRMSWNLRDGHMFETLQNVLQFRGENAKAVVWAHNSHVGDARATEMSKRGERNIGEMCARGFGDQSYRIGFGTDHGTVAAATDWGGPLEIKQLNPSHPQSYERQFHQTGLAGLVLPLHAGSDLDITKALDVPRLERAVGVIYRPDTELASHYFEAQLPRQFNEYIWIDETKAVTPLSTKRLPGLPDTYPFGT